MNKNQVAHESTMVCNECLNHCSYDPIGVCRKCLNKAMDEALTDHPEWEDPEFGEDEIDRDIQLQIDFMSMVDDTLDIEDREKRINGYPVEGVSKKGFYDEEGNYHRGGNNE